MCSARHSAVIVLMGVAGSGKTTAGRMLAETLRCPFLDGDSLHSAANVEKMRRGAALTDADRAAWLAAIHARMTAAFARGERLIVACSALKQSYRTILGRDLPVAWVYLKAPASLIASRLRQRTGHFMKAGMLASQFEVLEEPADAITIDASHAPEAIVEQIIERLRLRTEDG